MDTTVDLEYPSFGTIIIDGESHDHDVVIDDCTVRARDKAPSRPLKARFGHTPLSPDEDTPWSCPELVIGTGYSGRLPVMDEVHREAERRGVELIVLPTADAVTALTGTDLSGVNAILHVTC